MQCVVCSWEICVCSVQVSELQVRVDSQTNKNIESSVMCIPLMVLYSIFPAAQYLFSCHRLPEAHWGGRWAQTEDLLREAHGHWGGCWPPGWWVEGEFLPVPPVYTHTHSFIAFSVHVYLPSLCVSAEHCLKECRSFSAWTSSLFLGLLIAVNNNGIVFVEKIELCVWVFLMAHQ